jgi:hypothetical protein
MSAITAEIKTIHLKKKPDCQSFLLKVSLETLVVMFSILWMRQHIPRLNVAVGVG